MQAGISSGGREAEQRFRALTGASVSNRSADGDALLEGHNIEIKKASKQTINQVRPVKYLPLVVLYTPSDDFDEWYVVPPNQVVRLAAEKGRGQHTENPFESVTLSVNKIGDYAVSEENLHLATLEAIQEGESNQALKEAMREIRQKSADLASWSKKYVRGLL